MERQPIISQQEELSIKLVQKPLSLQDMLPKYQYQLQDVQVSEEARHMYEELINFLGTNEELIFQNVNSQDDYIKGFQRAMAMVRLWVDSIYVNDSVK